MANPPANQGAHLTRSMLGFDETRRHALLLLLLMTDALTVLRSWGAWARGRGPSPVSGSSFSSTSWPTDLADLTGPVSPVGPASAALAVLTFLTHRPLPRALSWLLPPLPGLPLGHSCPIWPASLPHCLAAQSLQALLLSGTGAGVLPSLVVLLPGLPSVYRSLITHTPPTLPLVDHCRPPVFGPPLLLFPFHLIIQVVFPQPHPIHQSRASSSKSTARTVVHPHFLPHRPRVTTHLPLRSPLGFGINSDSKARKIDTAVVPRSSIRTLDTPSTTRPSLSSVALFPLLPLHHRLVLWILNSSFQLTVDPCDPTPQASPSSWSGLSDAWRTEYHLWPDRQDVSLCLRDHSGDPRPIARKSASR